MAEVGADRLGIKKFTGPAQEKTRVSELLHGLAEDYRLRGGRAVPQVRSHIKPIQAHFGDLRAIDITEEAVDRYIQDRTEQGKKPATVNKETQLLGQAFKLGVRRKLINTAPHIRKLPERNARTGYFEAADFRAVVESLPDPISDIALFAYLSGWRKGEILGLTWAAMDRAAGEIRLGISKNGHGRVLPLVGELSDLVERRWQARSFKKADGGSQISEFIFHRAGRPIGEFRKSWAAACKQAGCEGRLFHDLRRTAIRNMTRAGVSQVVAMAISGHRTVAVFNRYNITSGADMVDALTKTQAHVMAGPGPMKVLPLR